MRIRRQIRVDSNIFPKWKNLSRRKKFPPEKVPPAVWIDGEVKIQVRSLTLLFAFFFEMEVQKPHQCSMFFCPHGKMNECPVKWDHFKRKCHLPSINFQGTCLFSGWYVCILDLLLLLRNWNNQFHYLLGIGGSHIIWGYLSVSTVTLP